MMGRQSADQRRFFYDFCLEDHVPSDHLLRRIDSLLDLDAVRQKLAPHYSRLGRPSVDPEFMIRMLIVGYCFGIRSERRLCDEVHLNLAYRWFCRLGLKDPVPDHSTFSLNRHGRFRKSDAFRLVFESVLRCCMAAGLVGGEGFAIDASVLEADASRYHGVAPNEVDLRKIETPVRGYDEVAATRTMIARTDERFGLRPRRLAADTAYGTGRMLDWLLRRDIEPHIPVWEMGRRKDGTFSRKDFTFDADANLYRCPGGKTLKTTGRVHDGKTILYRASKHDCEQCPLKTKCCPNAPQRKIPRDVNEAARDHARSLVGTEAYDRSRRERKKVEMLFAHLKRHLGFERMRLRGLSGAQDEFLLAATVQNLRRLATLTAIPPPKPNCA
ncbi:MAG: transposase [Alphaproteobacteria bacterium]|nr:transposase [Alphaproteobacteria bacterium]